MIKAIGRGIDKKDVGQAALDYASNGYPIFPAYLNREGKKIPLCRWGKGVVDWNAAKQSAFLAKQNAPEKPWKHSTLYHLRATTDPAFVRRWWARWPYAMIGLPTGQISGIVVLDVDIKNGVNGLEELRKRGFDLGQTAVSRTPTGGYHFFYKAPKGLAVKSSVGEIAPGVDVRGDGGMVILPPSNPRRGAEGYRFEALDPSELGAVH